jgi:hypothetical protein
MKNLADRRHARNPNAQAVTFLFNIGYKPLGRAKRDLDEVTIFNPNK